MNLKSQTYGDPSQPIPVVLIHGFLCNGLLFQPNIEQLKKHYRIITIDLPGFGDSRDLPATNNIQSMAEMVLNTLSSLSCDRFNLLGHSMGGMVALQTTLLAPQRVNSLCCFATSCNGQNNGRFETFERTKERMSADFEQVKRSIYTSWFVDGAQNRHFPLVAQSSALVQLETAHQALDAMAAFNVTEQLNQLKNPTLIISAERDKSYSIQSQSALKQQIPHAQWAILNHCAHCAHLEDEEGFNRVLGEWLEGE